MMKKDGKVKLTLEKLPMALYGEEGVQKGEKSVVSKDGSSEVFSAKTVNIVTGVFSKDIEDEWRPVNETYERRAPNCPIVYFAEGAG